MGLDITGLGSVADLAGTVVERFFPPKMTGAEKAQAQVQIQAMIQKRENALVEAKKAIVVSEMQQGDNYTKRARPTLVYAGLVFIALVYVIFPITAFFTARPMPELALPGEFWAAWGGVCSIWVIGRSAEKKGAANKLVSMITGR